MAGTTVTRSNGSLAGSTDSAQMPSANFQNGYIKAHPGNAGNVYIGTSSDVAIAGTTDANGGIALKASEYFPLGVPGNLNSLWYISDSSTDTIQYYIENW